MVENATLEDKQTFLTKLIDRKVRTQFAYRMGIDKETDVSRQINLVEQGTAYIAALETIVMHKIIPEDEIRKYYKNSKMEVRVRHIFLDLPADTMGQAFADKVAQAGQIIQKLRAGEGFAEIVKQMSKDEFTTKKGGDLGFLRWGSMDDVFMAIALKTGRYQIHPEPIITSKGVHVIQITDRRKVSQKPYEFERIDIIRKLYNKKRDEVTQEFHRFNDELDRKNRLVYHENNIRSFLDYLKRPGIDSLLQSDQSSPNPDYSWIDSRISNMDLIRYDEKAYTVVDFFSILSSQPNVPQANLLKDIDDIKKILRDKGRYDLTAAIGIRKGYLNKRQYKDQSRIQIGRILINELQKKYIDKPVETDDEMTKEFYRKNAKKYTIPVRMEVQEIFLIDSTEAQRVFVMANSGHSFDELATQFNTRSTTKDKKGLLGLLTENSLGAIGKTAVQMQPGEIKGPLKNDAGFSVIKALRRDEEHVAPFEEVQSRVQSDLRNEMRQNNQQEWESRMRDLIPVRVHNELLRDALQDFL
jgi:parvulin-like peptidyl-prolyl isomerase